MALNKFVWKNGTEPGTTPGPMTLTQDQVDVLIKAGERAANDDSFVCSVGGYITTDSHSLPRFKYEKMFGEGGLFAETLTPVNITPLPDVFGLSFSTKQATSYNYIEEGQVIPITSSNILGSSGITVNDLNWEFEFGSLIFGEGEQGGISVDQIRERIRVTNGQLEIDDPQENTTWRISMTIKAYPKYYSSFNDYVNALGYNSYADMPDNINRPWFNTWLAGIGITGLTATVSDEVASGSIITIKPTPIPETSTKLKDAYYEYEAITPSTIVVNESEIGGVIRQTVSSQSTGEGQIRVVLKLFKTASGTYRQTMSTDTNIFLVFDLRPTSFIIHQQDGVADPYAIINNGQHYNLMPDGDGVRLVPIPFASRTSSNDTILYLRENTHRYCGKYNRQENTMQLRQLKDTDSTRFEDGTEQGADATSYITNTTITDAASYDVWTKFGSDVYIKSQPFYSLDSNNGFTSENTMDSWQLVTISREIPNPDYTTRVPAPDGSASKSQWIKWDANKLIGCFEAYSNNGKLQSISGVRPTVNISQSTCYDRARSRGSNFKIVDYETHRLMGILGMGYYGTTDIQKVCGYGTAQVNSIYNKQCGLTNNLGMSDTDSTRLESKYSGNGATSPDPDQISAGYGSDLRSVNFWGLENWWGDIAEWMDDLMVMQAKRPETVATANPQIYLDDYYNQYHSTQGDPPLVINLNGEDRTVTAEDISAMNENQRFIRIGPTKDVSSTQRIIQFGNYTANSEGWIKSIILGQYCDTIPKSWGASSETYFADYGYVISPGYIGLRSGDSSSSYGGLVYLILYNGSGSTGAHVGSRLVFSGTATSVSIVDSFR